jgi:NMD protein affecting ribosome stability and mRNA decay
MENIVAQTVKKLYLELLKADENFLADTTDLYTYEMNLVESMKNAVTSHLSATLTQLNALIEKDSSRSSRFTIDRRDQRTIITTFGVVTFEHTYFRERETGKRRYLLDEMLQLDPHERLSQAAENAVLTEAARSSYQKAATRKQAMYWGRTVQSPRLPLWGKCMPS